MLTTIFILSGLAIATLLVAKRIEEKRKRNIFILNLISKGDVHVRELHHGAVKFYSVSKERAVFFVRKQLPMRSKSALNKAAARLETALERHFEGMRGSKLLKKSEGISEFFKSMSDVEKGGGELHDEVYLEKAVAASEEPIEIVEKEVAIEKEVPKTEPTIELVRFEIDEAEEPVNKNTSNPVINSQPKAKKPKKAPVRRRLKISSQEEPVVEEIL